MSNMTFRTGKPANSLCYIYCKFEKKKITPKFCFLLLPLSSSGQSLTPPSHSGPFLSPLCVPWLLRVGHFCHRWHISQGGCWTPHQHISDHELELGSGSHCNLQAGLQSPTPPPPPQKKETRKTNKQTRAKKPSYTQSHAQGSQLTVDVFLQKQ